MNNLPRYSEDGLFNRDVFLARKSELLVYFEDEGWEEFYLALLDKLGVKVSYSSIFCLGGKGNLKKKLEDAAERGNERLFVVDKDFDDLLNKVIVSDEVVYLGRYSIENYFFTLVMIEDFVVSQRKGVRREEVQALVDSDALEQFLAWYRECCAYFIVALKYRLKIESTKVKFSDICLLPSGDRCEDWWHDYLRRFYERVHLDSPHLLEENRLDSALASAFESVVPEIADGEPTCHLPGKHLLGFLVERIRPLLPQKDSEDAIYKLMMSSIHSIDRDIVVDLSARLARAL